jgi:uncharacterized damage-inducible protein DinB
MTPDHAKVVAATIGQNLQSEWKLTYKVLGAVPENNKSFKLDPHSRSMWELAHHIAVCDVGFLHAVKANSFTGFPAKTPAKTVAELTDWYKHEFPKALEGALALDGPHLSQIVEAFGMKLPSVIYMFFCNNHMIHHRGQLAAFLRPAGGKVPAMYGESFDEKFKGF